MAVAEICVPRRLEKGQILFHQGAEGYEIFVVLSGRLRVEASSSDGKPVTIAMRGARDVIGEMAIIEKLPRSATVSAETDCRLLVIHRDEFTRLIEKSPTIALSLLQHLSARVREVTQALTDSRSETLRHRVLQYLHQRQTSEGNITIRDSQKVAAQELGCSREAFSRNLKQLCDEGKIQKLGRGKFLLIDVAAADERALGR